MLENPNESHDHPAQLRAAKSYVIPPMTQLVIKVSCSRSGLSVIQQTLKRSSGSRHFIANGLVELPPALSGRHSTVMVSNMQKKPLRVQKGQVIGAADQLTCLLLPPDDSAPDYWKERTSLGGVPEDLRYELVTLREKYNHMWSGRLGEIKGVEHCITTTGIPIHQQPYRAGPQLEERFRTSLSL
jgi:hypothetical protein